jgi:creatinine amidohydrolase
MSIHAFGAAWTDVAAHFANSTGLAILPFGALEQHGPHLPLGTDTITAEHVSAELAERLDAVLLPAVNYGDTWNNAGYPGTISLSPSTVTAIAVDIGRAVAASGGRGLVVVNGDWGNRAPLYSAMRILADEGAISAVTLDYPGMDAAIAAIRESRPAAAGLNHAEEVETSIVLALAPHLVHTDRYESSYPHFPSDFGTRPMQLHPFSASGVFGDPATASVVKGAEILAATITESLHVLTDFVTSLQR